jgi:hypothetical protein
MREQISQGLELYSTTFGTKYVVFILGRVLSPICYSLPYVDKSILYIEETLSSIVGDFR